MFNCNYCCCYYYCYYHSHDYYGYYNYYDGDYYYFFYLCWYRIKRQLCCCQWTERLSAADCLFMQGQTNKVTHRRLACKALKKCLPA